MVAHAQKQPCYPRSYYSDWLCPLLSSRRLLISDDYAYTLCVSTKPPFQAVVLLIWSVKLVRNRWSKQEHELPTALTLPVATATVKESWTSKDVLLFLMLLLIVLMFLMFFYVVLCFVIVVVLFFVFINIIVFIVSKTLFLCFLPIQ